VPPVAVLAQEASPELTLPALPSVPAPPPSTSAAVVPVASADARREAALDRFLGYSVLLNDPHTAQTVLAPLRRLEPVGFPQVSPSFC
jgi:hypothetical protein